MSQLLSGLECKSDDEKSLELENLRKRKAIGILYSKNSDEECRKFVTTLRNLKETLNQTEPTFEVVLLSGDEMEPALNITATRTKFPYVPFKGVSEYISKLKDLIDFDAKLFPQLILIDPKTEQVITALGVDRIAEDPEAKKFPWTPNIGDALGKEFANGGEKQVSINFAAYSRNNRNAYTVAVLFADEDSCGDVLKNWKECHKNVASQCFSIVVSLDTWNYQFQKWFDSIKVEEKKQVDKWLKVPFANVERRRNLKDSLHIKKLPSIVLLNSKLQVLHNNALEKLEQDPSGEKFPWNENDESQVQEMTE